MVEVVFGFRFEFRGFSCSSHLGFDVRTQTGVKQDLAHWSDLQSRGAGFRTSSSSMHSRRSS